MGFLVDGAAGLHIVIYLSSPLWCLSQSTWAKRHTLNMTQSGKVLHDRSGHSPNWKEPHYGHISGTPPPQEGCHSSPQFALHPHRDRPRGPLGVLFDYAAPLGSC